MKSQVQLNVTNENNLTEKNKYQQGQCESFGDCL